MGERLVPGVVPSTDQVPSRARSVPVRGQDAGLPVAEVATPRVARMIHGMARVDGSGRVLDRALLRDLGWEPGQPVLVRVIEQRVVLRPDPTAVHRLPWQPCLVLPIAARTRCHIRTGDRVLLTADLEQDVLVVRPLWAVEDLLAAEHARLLEGGGAS
ncbi:AbrB/MazE/SpoVT family DNA-binding domain-containing protein [Saccharopolyspora taberi]